MDPSAASRVAQDRSSIEAGSRRRILLFYNSPRTRRYYESLARHVGGADIVVRGVWGAGSERATTALVEEIIDYGMRRKRARPHLGPARLAFFRGLYGAGARHHYAHARLEIERWQPDAVGVWGGNTVDANAVAVAARTAGAPCFRFENGYLPATTQMDLQGVNASSSIPRDPAFYAAYGGEWPTAQAADLVPRAPRRGKQAAAPVELPARYVFVPFQFWLDSQVLLNSPWLKRMEELFDAMIEAQARLGPDAPALVFKEHPNCARAYEELEERARASGRARFANGHATGQLIERSLGVVTINSSVGTEALLMGKPVLALGEAVYAIPGVAAAARSVDGITHWLEAVAAGRPPGAGLRGPFLRWLATEYLIPGRHQAPTPEHYAAVAARFAQIPARRNAA